MAVNGNFLVIASQVVDLRIPGIPRGFLRDSCSGLYPFFRLFKGFLSFSKGCFKGIYTEFIDKTNYHKASVEIRGHEGSYPFC